VQASCCGGQAFLQDIQQLVGSKIDLRLAEPVDAVINKETAENPESCVDVKVSAVSIEDMVPAYRKAGKLLYDTRPLMKREGVHNAMFRLAWSLGLKRDPSNAAELVPKLTTMPDPPHSVEYLIQHLRALARQQKLPAQLQEARTRKK
jgi:hypothetical protein